MSYSFQPQNWKSNKVEPNRFFKNPIIITLIRVSGNLKAISQRLFLSLPTPRRNIFHSVAFSKGLMSLFGVGQMSGVA